MNREEISDRQTEGRKSGKEGEGGWQKKGSEEQEEGLRTIILLYFSQ